MFSFQAYDLPLATPFRIAYDTVTESRNVLVMADRSGLVGYGEGGPVPTITGETVDQTVAALAAWQDTGARVPARFPERRLGLAASLAIETAALDLGAREAGVPLCRHLGGPAPSPILTSITLPIEGPDQVRARVRRHVRAGFQAFKVKTGAGLAEDLERVAIVREEVGDAEIRVDANQGWSLADARKALPQLAELGVDVLEQPLKKDDLKGHAALVADGVLPIMLDESVFSPADAERVIAAGAADRINIKLQKTGSVTAALSIADIAQEAGVPCMVGCMIESRVGILAAGHVVAAHKNIRWADLDGHTFLRSDPVTGGGTVRDGRLHLGGADGLGISRVQQGDRPTVPA